MTALDWGFDIPETTAKLMEVSDKAKENGAHYAVLTTENAAAAVNCGYVLDGRATRQRAESLRRDEKAMKLHIRPQGGVE